MDNDPGLVGQDVDGLVVRPVEELHQVVKEYGISIAVVAVPGVHTQEVIDRLVECGVRAILNYAPTTPQVPPDVNIRNIDPVLSLQSMTFYLAN